MQLGARTSATTSHSSMRLHSALLFCVSVRQPENHMDSLKNLT
jgi:hypothetical protein